MQGKLDQVSPEERQNIEPFLIKYAQFFQEEEGNDLQGTTVIEHHISVGDTQLIRRPQYRNP
jgi:hypothetical protein